MEEACPSTGTQLTMDTTRGARKRRLLNDIILYAVLGTIEEKGYNTYPIGKCNKAEAFLPTVTSHYRVHLLSRYFDII